MRVSHSVALGQKGNHPSLLTRTRPRVSLMRMWSPFSSSSLAELRALPSRFHTTLAHDSEKHSRGACNRSLLRAVNSEPGTPPRGNVASQLRTHYAARWPIANAKLMILFAL